MSWANLTSKDEPIMASATSWDADFDGDKYFGSFGTTLDYQMDYVTLRTRSNQLFTENKYARGIISRLLTNEINTGLCPEAYPVENVIGVELGSLSEWTDDVEDRFSLWGNDPIVCDYRKESTFGEIQSEARMAALIDGDVLQVVRVNRATGTPEVQLIPADKIVGEADGVPEANTVRYGVETDPKGAHVAYHIRQEDGEIKRLKAYGNRGRRVARMIYGTRRRLNAVRGEPLLSIILTSLKELDRYSDNVQRKAAINSLFAMFVKKTEDKPGTLPISNSATRKQEVQTPSSETSAPRKLDVTKHEPGVYFEELQTGEEPVAFNTASSDLHLGPFEETVVSAISWVYEIPPEILRPDILEQL